MLMVSEVIAFLQGVQAEHGDVELVICDADTGWYWRCTGEVLRVEDVDGVKRVSIGGNYGMDSAPDPTPVAR